MQNIYEKAQEFKQKTITPSQRDKHILPETAVNILNMLDEKADEMTREISQLTAYSGILSREIYYIESELEEFLMLYYEKFSEVVMSNPKYRLRDISTIDSELEEARKFRIEADNVALFDNKLKARNEELKKNYRLLAKDLHPDVNDTLVAKFLFNHVKKLHDQGNLDELMYVKTKIEKGRELQDIKSVVQKIEMLEKDVNLSAIRKRTLEAKKEQLTSSPEYRLYTKYKISQFRGEDFFKLLLESFG